MNSARIVEWARSALLVLAALTGAPALARADETDVARATLLDRIRTHPTDYETTFEYIRLAIAARDYEAAIAALERLLFFNPELTRAKYELGALYFRLGSNAMAARYFEEALAAGDLDTDLRARAEVYAPMARKELQPDRVYGTLETGLRFNSNPAGLPSAGVFGSLLVATPAGAPPPGQSDVAAFALADLRYVHDFGNERGDVFEARVQTYGTLQFRFPTLDVGLLNVSAGPRLALAPEALPGWTLHPYAAFSGSELNGALFTTAAGGGLGVGIPIARWFSLEPGLEWLGVANHDPNALTTDGLLNAGNLWTGSLTAKWSVAERVTVNARASYASNRAVAPLASAQSGLEASVKFDFDPLVAGPPLLWSLTPYARYADIAFDSVNKSINLSAPRHDRQWRVGAQVDMPITARFGLTTLMEYQEIDSNVAQFQSSGWSVALGATVRF